MLKLLTYSETAFTCIYPCKSGKTIRWRKFDHKKKHSEYILGKPFMLVQFWICGCFWHNEANGANYLASLTVGVLFEFEIDRVINLFSLFLTKVWLYREVVLPECGYFWYAYFTFLHIKQNIDFNLNCLSQIETSR